MAGELILGLGELLWDCFPDGERPGGAPANFAYHAAQLGYTGGVLSRVGTDERGRNLLAWLHDKGVRADLVQVDPDHPTGTVTVDISEPRRPRFVIHENVAWDHMENTPQWRSALAEAAAVCFGTLAQRSRVSREAILSLLRDQRARRLIVYDVNLRQDFYTREIIEASLRLARLVKLNTEESHVVRELLGISEPSDAQFCRALMSRYDVEAVCITRGEHGCLLVDGSGWAESPGVEVTVADTVGAGDAFTAAWVAARLWGWNLTAQAEFANRVGALVASLPGAMPPVAANYRDLLREMVARNA